MATAQQSRPLVGIEIDITIIQARGLVAKDRHRLHRKTSDPFVKLFCFGKPYGQTKAVEKNLDPKWNESFKIQYGERVANALMKENGEQTGGSLVFQLFDEDRVSSPDPMGTVSLPLPGLIRTPPTTQWYPVGKGVGSNECKDAKGEIEIKIAVSARRALSLVKGNTTPISSGSQIRVGLGWEMEGGKEIDLDTSCVGVDGSGNVLMDETVYFGDLVNSNGSIRHTGDEREGDENIGGSGDDEVITVNLDRVPARVLALYFIATVATSGKTFADVKSALVRVTEQRTRLEMCRFVPVLSGENTALFLMRIARDGGSSRKDWALSVIEDSDHTARDFGSLIPEIKGYTRDLVPNIKIDPKERIAVMRKGGTIHLRDVPNTVVLGLKWDVTHGRNIDLDASAICLDASLRPVEIIYFKNLRSRNGAIRHGGDEREGDASGDDEKIFVYPSQVDENVAFICFVVNSFSGQELDDVSRASCHLFDFSTRKDIAQYMISNAKDLDRHTALLMACLYRDDSDSEGWCLRIISEAAHGRLAKDNVDELQNFLKRNPLPTPAIQPEPEIIVNEMPAPVPVDEEIVVNPLVPTYEMANLSV